MERGAIETATLDGPMDLQATVESGQSYLWNRDDGRDYDAGTDDGRGAHGGDAWYWTTVRRHGEPAVVRVRQVDDALEWEASFDAVPVLRRRLRLDDDLDAVRAGVPDRPVVTAAFDAYPGLRLVRDPPFPTLVTFICSAQMRVARIHAMQRALRETFGEPVTFDGETYHAYPRPSTLAATTEADLRDVGLGYRAPYVRDSARLVADGDAHPADALGREYEAAREYLTRFVGVGEKVADCVLLFSLGFLAAVPLDTWIRRTIGEHFPDCDRGNYTDTSRAIRNALGGDLAGYAQTYVFHFLRNGGELDAAVADPVSANDGTE